MFTKETYQIKTIKPIFYSLDNSSIVKYITDTVKGYGEAVKLVNDIDSFETLLESTKKTLKQLEYDISYIVTKPKTPIYKIQTGVCKKKGDYMEFIYGDKTTRYYTEESRHETEVRKCCAVVARLEELNIALGNDESFETLISKAMYITKSLLRKKCDGSITAPVF